MQDMIRKVKRSLKITWNDDDTELEIADIVANAVPALNHKLGISYTVHDYKEASAERSLFINYCRYAYNNCSNEFDQAFFNEIMQLRFKHGVEDEEAGQLQ